MLDVLLKIRNRVSRDFVLTNLNGWLATFSDNSKYNVHIYNEDFQLPQEYYSNYIVINKPTILNTSECRNLYTRINQSRISQCWKNACFSLVFAYFYFKGTEYVWNIDACDTVYHNNIENYGDKLLNVIKEHNLTTVSYDYILSFNIFDHWKEVKNRFIPNHWSFGVNL